MTYSEWLKKEKERARPNRTGFIDASRTLGVGVGPRGINALVGKKTKLTQKSQEPKK